MKNLKKRLALVMVLAFMFTMVMGSSAFAATTTLHKVDAYSGVKIIYNGMELTGASQPYIINDTTYVPLRLIMENFGNGVYWDALNYRVILTGNTSKDAEIAALKKQIAELENTIAELEGADLDDIEDDLYDIFEDMGDDYFDDDEIIFSLSLGGDEDDIAYTVKLDFDDSNDYDDLTDVDMDDIEEFLDDLESEIYDAIDDTDYEDADVTGKLSDKDNSSYYVKFNGSSYTFSWDNGDDLDDIADAVYDAVDDLDYYFDDDGIYFTLSLDGDEDDLEYYIEFDFSHADDYWDLSDLDEDDIEDFLDDVAAEIYDEIEDTDFEDADLTGELVDNDDSDLYVEFDGDSYDYNL